MPTRRNRRARWWSSWILALVYCGLGFAYLNPDEFVRNPDATKRSATNSVIAFIENLTVVPGWGIAFLVAGVALIVTLTIGKRNADRYIPYPLLVGGVIFTMYAFASWSTAIISPGSYITGAIMSTGLAAISFVLMYNYSRKPSALDVVAEDEQIIAKG